MQTRNLDYSNKNQFVIRFSDKLMMMIQNYHVVRGLLTPIQRVKRVNHIMHIILKYMPSIICIQNEGRNLYFEDMEKLFHVLFHRKTVFHVEMMYESEHNNPHFMCHYYRLMQKCNKLNAILTNYFHRKSMAVLLKTNRDIYRHILNFL